MNCPNCGAEERMRSGKWIFFKCDSYLRENMHVLTSDECDLRKENNELKKRVKLLQDRNAQNVIDIKNLIETVRYRDDRVKELEDYIKSSVQKT